MNMDKPDTHMKIFLWLIAVHSFLVGIALILFPPSYLEFFGFSNYQYSFFQAQGGVFHLVILSVGYFGILDNVDEKLKKRDQAERKRIALNEIVFKNTWNGR